MKIAYIDAGVTDFHEDYGVNAFGYGGGSCFAKYAKYLVPNFTLFAQKESFANFYEWEKNLNIRELSVEQSNLLKDKNPIDVVIPEITNYDIILHHHDLFSFNKGGFEGLQIHWALMGDLGANSGNDYSLVYNAEPPQNSNFYKVQIGKYVSEIFEEHDKEKFIFQCSRHDEFMGSIELAKECINKGIRCIFAGRIMGGYPLMDYIDNKKTFFIGNISEEEKLFYLKRSSAMGLLCKWDNMPFNQSIIEALSCGTPIITNRNNFTQKIIQDGANGIFFNGSLDFKKIQNIDQKTCWESAHKYSHIEMIKSFLSALKDIVNRR